MPGINDALDTLQGFCYFSSLDLRAVYWLTTMQEEDKAITASVTPDGLFEFNVMPFGLTNAPTTFSVESSGLHVCATWMMSLLFPLRLTNASQDCQASYNAFQRLVSSLTQENVISPHVKLKS